MQANVLDCGNVELVAYMGSDLMVANAARVSFSKHKTVFDDKDARLLSFLSKNHHWTPFAHPQITLRVKAPIFVKNQLFKHKVGFVENEESRRYVDYEPEFYVPKVLRSRPTGSMKQGSGPNIEDSSLIEKYRAACMQSVLHYNELIDAGVAPEQARGMLPLAMYTQWYWTGSLYGYARMYGLRYAPDAQLETKLYAQAIGSLIAPLFPVSWSVLTESKHEQGTTSQV